ncbi:MAG TPA: M4 family metallopeptidase, partial [Kofleriaceae bacterium]
FGDGKVPTADFSDEDDCDSRETKGNNQTAGVDAEFSHAVVWDLFKNVVGLAGWGRDGTQGTDIYTHWQENNSEYVPTILTAGEHINLGDGNWKAGGSPHTSMSVVGHEFTHGMDHDFGTLALTGPNVMSEGIADIGGVLAQIYQRSHGFANHDTGVTDTGNLDDFTVFGEILATATSHHSKRFLDRPSLDGESTDVYFDGIEDMEPHASSGPIRRALYYIMKGASAHDDWDHQTAWRSNTPLLPWGLPGLGVDKGADIYFDTFFGCMDDSDFDQARTCAVQVANELFGSAAAQTVKNAFAGVNVGATAGYPRAPAAFAESEPNETNGIATPVDWASPPAGFEGVFKMDLVGTLSGPSDIDEYKFSAKCGRHIGAQVSAFSIGAIGKPTMRLFWLDTSRNVWVAEGAASDPSGHDTLSVDASGFCSGTAQQQFILKVTSGSGNATGFYDVHIDAQ